ncbi:MAG: hypothetical protein ACFFBD_03675 [Candidatus Hodarchaeota archaeon]
MIKRPSRSPDRLDNLIKGRKAFYIDYDYDFCHQEIWLEEKEYCVFGCYQLSIPGSIVEPKHLITETNLSSNIILKMNEDDPDVLLFSRENFSELVSSHFHNPAGIFYNHFHVFFLRQMDSDSRLQHRLTEEELSEKPQIHEKPIPLYLGHWIRGKMVFYLDHDILPTKNQVILDKERYRISYKGWLAIPGTIVNPVHSVKEDNLDPETLLAIDEKKPDAILFCRTGFNSMFTPDHDNPAGVFHLIFRMYFLNKEK